MGSDNSSSNLPPAGPKRDPEKTPEELVREKDKEFGQVSHHPVPKEPMMKR